MSRDALARGHIDAAPPAGGGAASGFRHAAGVSRIKPADRPPHARGKPIAQTAHEGRAFPPMRSPANGDASSMPLPPSSAPNAGGSCAARPRDLGSAGMTCNGPRQGDNIGGSKGNRAEYALDDESG
ncbi:hypothetical protein Y023_1237 [Burkholderia pseudomallei A79D]|nr:hypothetical protein X993_1591 [Burkholderia pseudomallei K42]AIV91113.1 hypothetical protein X995_656 [Burkholderia pseudomallei B03]AIV96464.1 hypothetical protein X996_608 [Burkholderia pseudomallei A79A]KGX95182.1 hypothetical protein Y023_1237 [Burkholderia pseudomallei A79D]KGX96554.1 hypothetical protein X997_1095 [Burkholderia pseudomallei A79C]